MEPVPKKLKVTTEDPEQQNMFITIAELPEEIRLHFVERQINEPYYLPKHRKRFSRVLNDLKEKTKYIEERLQEVNDLEEWSVYKFTDSEGTWWDMLPGLTDDPQNTQQLLEFYSHNVDLSNKLPSPY